MKKGQDRGVLILLFLLIGAIALSVFLMSAGIKAGRNQESNQVYIMEDIEQYCNAVKAVNGDVSIRYGRDLKNLKLTYTGDSLTTSFAVPFKKDSLFKTDEFPELCRNDIARLTKSRFLDGIKLKKPVTLTCPKTLYIMGENGNCILSDTRTSSSEIEATIITARVGGVQILPETIDGKINGMSLLLKQSFGDQAKTYNSISGNPELAIRIEKHEGETIIHYNQGAEKLASEIVVLLQSEISTTLIGDNEPNYKESTQADAYLFIELAKTDQLNIINVITQGVEKHYGQESITES